MKHASLRILAIAPTAFYNDYGCHIRIMGQLRGLQARGHRIRLVTYPVGRDLPDLDVTRAPLPGLKQLSVGSSRIKVLLDAILGPTALIAAYRFRPHLIHAYLHEGVLIGWMLSKWLRVPLTCDYQGSLTSEMIAHRFLSPESHWRPILQRLEAWLDWRPSALLVSSQHALETLAMQGIPDSRLYVLPDAVDPIQFSPQPPDASLRARLGLAPELPTLVYLGLLAPYQGVDLFLTALSRLKGAWQALVMGFPHVDRYRAMAQALGIGQRVIFPGAIPYEMAPRYLALGQLAMAPKLATSEGSGKLLPYMSMGLPVVATDTPAHRQYLGDLGIYTAPDATAMANTLAHALERLDLLRHTGMKLRQRVLEQYTWVHTAAQMERIFYDVL